MPRNFYAPLEFGPQSRFAALACGVCLIVEIGLTAWPKGWVGLVHLTPVVLAFFLWSGWLVAGVGAFSLLMWQFFSPVIWIPPPATVLMIVSVSGLLQGRQHRKEIRQKDAQYQGAHRERLEWRAFFDKSLAAILTADGDGRIIIANAAAHSLLGFEPGALVGQGIASCLPAMAAAPKNGRAESAGPQDYRMPGAASERRDISGRCLVFGRQDGDGDPAGRRGRGCIGAPAGARALGSALRDVDLADCHEGRLARDTQSVRRRCRDPQ